MVPILGLMLLDVPILSTKEQESVISTHPPIYYKTRIIPYCSQCNEPLSST